jgi:hypothetical protein
LTHVETERVGKEPDVAENFELEASVEGIFEWVDLTRDGPKEAPF